MMALALTGLSLRFWRGRGRGTPPPPLPASHSAADFGLGSGERDYVKFPSAEGTETSSTARRLQKKLRDREVRRIDREFDLVMVPSDGAGSFGSESGDSDWSIGWLEPHAPGFLSDGEEDDSFLVLVPCYGCGSDEAAERPKNQLLAALLSENAANGRSTDGKYLERWLSALHQETGRHY